MIERGSKKSKTAGFPKGWTDELQTPKWLYSQLTGIFHFDADAAAGPENALAPCYWRDSLVEKWSLQAKRVYLNPPYSNVQPFLLKAQEEQEEGVLTVALLKLDPSVEWWDATETAYIQKFRHRIRFDYQGKPAPYAASFPSCLATYYPIRDAKDELAFRYAV